MNTLKGEREQTTPTDKYPWLDPEDERRHMTDREILEKYVNLNNSCLKLRRENEGDGYVVQIQRSI